MKAKQLPFVLIPLLFLNSCAYHSGVMTGNASLSNANFAVVNFVIG